MPQRRSPLFSANRSLALPDDPVERLWQLCTSLREHRGDGHVAALTAKGLDGLEAHVLIALEGTERLQRTCNERAAGPPTTGPRRSIGARREGGSGPTGR
jgi:hypothetical protein